MERPAGPAAGTQQWRALLFLHWEVAVDAMRSVVPAALELDLFEGRAYVGLVPFLMRDIRPRWLPKRLAFNFHETNVRTYVTFRGRPGVYFFSLDADSRLAVWAARWGWHLPYYYARMHHRRDGDTAQYRVRRGRQFGCDVEYEIGAPLGPSEPGSLEYFLLERYLLFTEHRGTVWTGQVSHQPYPARQVAVQRVEQTLIPAGGIEIADEQPQFAHYSEGVDVEVFALRSSS